MLTTVLRICSTQNIQHGEAGSSNPVLDAYVKQTGLLSRSAAVQRAIRMFRHPALEEDCGNAWAEWSTAGDGGAFGAGYRTSCAAWSARSSRGCGMTPNPMVTAAHTAIAALLQMPGITTVTSSAGASVKNISTITRT